MRARSISMALGLIIALFAIRAAAAEPGKTVDAAKKHDVDLVTLSGGVSCNKELRRQLAAACKRYGFELKTAEPWLCTDNAAMIAFAAMLKLQNGVSASVTEEIDPNLALAV